MVHNDLHSPEKFQGSYYTLGGPQPEKVQFCVKMHSNKQTNRSSPSPRMASSLPLVAAVLIAPKGTESPGIGRMIGALVLFFSI